MAPIVELRLGIPLGIIEYSLEWGTLLLLCVLGNFLICIPILYLLDFFDKLSEKSHFLSTILNKIYSRTRSKAHIINKYNYLGIILFVGIPLPFTGAWTGCLASHLLGLDIKKTMLSILIGLIMSSIIVTLVTILAQHFLPYIGINL